jgi:hypothetical protein
MTRSFFPPSARLLVLSLLPACITGGGRSHQLYPGDARPPAEVARLIGPIGAVDGQDVSKFGKSFALLPGCHVVKLAEKTGEISEMGSGGYVASLPAALYAFRMQARHTYEIQVQLDGNAPPVGRITIRAWDRAPDGLSVEISPVASPAEIDDCLKGTPVIPLPATGGTSGLQPG